MWKLFLDDERYPPTDTLRSNWRIARNVDDAIYYIRIYGRPDYMSLDHDLGYGKQTGMDFCKWLVNWSIDTGWTIPDFFIHSQNPVGAENMASYLVSGINFLIDQQV
jgi:hypothetical protein